MISDILLVLGMHRSGTSAMAGALTLSGFHAGADLLPPSKFNPKGYFESKTVNEINDEYLALHDRRWDDPREMSYLSTQEPCCQKLIEKINAFIAREGTSHSSLLFKDPRMCRALPLWMPSLLRNTSSIGAVIMIRDPAEVVASLIRRENMNPSKAALLYSVYLLDAELYSRNLKRVVLDFSDLISKPANAIDKIMSSLLPKSGATIDSKADLVSEFVQSDLRSLAGEIQIDLDSNFYCIAKDVYRLLSHGSIETASKEFEGLRKNLELGLKNLEPWLSDSIKANRAKGDYFFAGDFAKSAVEGMAVASLYWRFEDTKFDDSRVVRSRHQVGSGAQVIKLKPGNQLGRISSLQLRPGNYPMYFSLWQISICNSSGQALWSLTKEELWQLNSHDGLHILKSGPKDALRFIALGFDARINISAPDIALDTLSRGGELEVAISADFIASSPALSALAIELAEQDGVETEPPKRFGSQPSIPQMNEDAGPIPSGWLDERKHHNTPSLRQLPSYWWARSEVFRKIGWRP